MSIDYVDCQSFAGGFALGVTLAGGHLVGKREHAGAFGAPAMEANRHLLGHDWETQAGTADEWQPMRVPLVIGNPPCSFASTYSTKSFRGENSPIVRCWYDFIDFGARCDADIVIGESVQQAFTGTYRMLQRFHALLQERADQPYNLYHVLHDSYGLGGCAVRKRYFWLASRIPFGLERPPFIAEDDRPLIKDAWGDLVMQELSWQPRSYRMPPTRWSAGLRAGTVDGHDSPASAPDHFRTLDLVNSVGWEVGENQAQVLRRYYDEHGDLPQTWQQKKAKVLERDFPHAISGPGRWRWDGPGRVIMGNSVDAVLHPLLPRFITHREALRMMSFPDEWRIAELNPRRVRAFWGKGITVPAGRWIGDWAMRAINGQPGSFQGIQVGEREFVIDVTNDYKRTETERAKNDAALAKKFDAEPPKPES